MGCRLIVGFILFAFGVILFIAGFIYPPTFHNATPDQIAQTLNVLKFAAIGDLIVASIFLLPLLYLVQRWWTIRQAKYVQTLELTDDDLLNNPSYSWETVCPRCKLSHSPNRLRVEEIDGCAFRCWLCGIKVHIRRNGNTVTFYA